LYYGVRLGRGQNIWMFLTMDACVHAHALFLKERVRESTLLNFEVYYAIFKLY
jgi:hypothetical protein